MLAAIRDTCELYLLQEMASFSSEHSSKCPDTVTVSFETDYTLGNIARIGVTGSIEELGKWDPTECVLAVVTPPGSGHWKATISLPSKTTFSWKWVVVSADRSKVWRWEERDDRESYTGTINACLSTPWNGDVVYTPVTHGDTDEGPSTEKEMPLHIVRPSPSIVERFKRSFCTIL